MEWEFIFLWFKRKFCLLYIKANLIKVEIFRCFFSLGGWEGRRSPGQREKVGDDLNFTVSNV